jgi:hypothetical protein
VWQNLCMRRIRLAMVMELQDALAIFNEQSEYIFSLTYLINWFFRYILILFNRFPILFRQQQKFSWICKHSLYNEQNFYIKQIRIFRKRNNSISEIIIFFNQLLIMLFHVGTNGFHSKNIFYNWKKQLTSRTHVIYMQIGGSSKHRLSDFKSFPITFNIQAVILLKWWRTNRWEPVEK